MNRSINESDEQRFVTTAQVSQALGVSVTTVKRWVDDDILPARRTAGGHRKLLVADVLRAIRQGDLPQGDLSLLLPRGGAKDLPRLFTAAVEKPDPAAIRDVIHRAYRGGLLIETIADTILAPAMTRLGTLWETGRIDVMHEHRVSEAAMAALFELESKVKSRTGSGRPVAVGGAPEGDYSLLPTLLAKLTLADCGWEAINLGPHTPFDSFFAALDEFTPRLIWLSVTHVIEEESFLKNYLSFYREAARRGVAVAIGGNGLQSDLRAKMPYTMFGDGLTNLASFARTLHRPPQRPKRGRPAS